MLKVACDSCQAPYQIDERRISPAGLKMRCPKCGHSFIVAHPGAAPGIAPQAARVAIAVEGSELSDAVVHPSRAVPVAPPPSGPPPAAAASPTSGERAPFPSDFPAALGFLDEADLPVVSPELPSPKVPLPRSRSVTPVAIAKAPASPPKTSADRSAAITRPAMSAVTVPVQPPPDRSVFDDFGADLPSLGAALPVAKPPANRPPQPLDADLPSLAAALPVATAGLPAVAAALPAPSAQLPVAAAGLSGAAASPPAFADAPSTPAHLRRTGGGRAFGEIDLPVASDSLPVVAPASSHLPAVASNSEGLGGAFGEIDLPRANPSSAPPSAGQPRDSKYGEPARFERELPTDRDSLSGGGPAGTSGGMSFGEVDFGGGEPAAGTAIGMSPQAGPIARVDPQPWAPADQSAATAPVETPARRQRSAALRARPPIAKAAGLAIAVAALVGGAALQLTPYGAFGYLVATDIVAASSYERATQAAIHDTDRALAADTYDEAKAAVDAVYAAHLRMPRARALTAYAALVEYATSIRFGPDPGRAPRAKQLLAELPRDAHVAFRDLAIAAQAAEGGDLERSLKAFGAGPAASAGPGQLDADCVRGDVELAAHDGAAALAEFKRAAAISSDARVHFGLARAYDAVGDSANTRNEIAATLAASHDHPGALTLRAHAQSAAVDPAHALADIARVLDGPSRVKASPSELSDAYAARAWVDLASGGAGRARESFDQAVRLNPSNVDALNGQGRLLLADGRYAEALARLDTALKLSPSSPETIANDAEARLALERLADAKQQLVAARERFPTSIPILLVLGKAEQHLGNIDAAEADLRAAVASADPLRPDAVAPYVALSELLSARGRLADARALLDDANRKLPPSSALDRASGGVSELEGDYDGAIAHYRTAIDKTPNDLAAHFRLAVVLRRLRRFDAASVELDRIGAVDGDYPGLLLERGLLFEESGNVEKAIEQFKQALSRAPEDPDLQLRVGSAYVVIGRPDDALPMLRKVLEKRPASAEAHHFIGRALMVKGGSSAADALHFLHRAAELDPNRAEFHVYLAWAANDAIPAQLELARDEIDRAMSLDKLNAEAYWQRGVLERMEGAIDDAMKDERRALELRPSRYEAHATLAECLEDKNDDAAALIEWTRAIAGDASSAGSDAAVPHPYWRYRYGKLLGDKGGKAAALPQLLAAATTAEKMDVRPGWLVPLEFLTADALRRAGRKAEAAEHYRRFLEMAPVSSPDRADAQSAIAELSGKR